MSGSPAGRDGRSMRERMLVGDWYIAEDPENARRAQRAVGLADAYHRAAVVDETSAVPLLAQLLGQLGGGAFIEPPLYVDYGEHISVGAGTFVTYNLAALGGAPPRTAADSQIGPNVQLRTGLPPGDRGPRRARWEAADP